MPEGSLAKPGSKDHRRMPRAFLPKVKAFDPCWDRAEWSALVEFLAGEEFPEAAEELKAKLEGLTGCSAVPVFQGRDGLLLATAVLGLRPGDEVICPSFVCETAVQPFIKAGLKPVAADVDESLCLDPTSVERCIGERTRAILMVHMFGTVCRVVELRELAARYELRLIDDAAGALGSTFDGRPASTLGDVGVLSFGYGKIASSVGGGALVCGDRAPVEMPILAGPRPMEVKTRTVLHVGRTIRHCGLVPAIKLSRKMASTGRKMMHPTPESRRMGGDPAAGQAMPKDIAGVQAKLASIQMDKLDDMLKIRKRNYDILRSELEGVDGIRLTARSAESDAHLYFALLVDCGHRYDLGSHLAGHGYETVWGYYPLHLQNMGVSPGAPLPVTEDVWRRIVAVPIHPRVNEEDAVRMARLISRWAEARAR